jgi:hypothetical protein
LSPAAPECRRGCAFGRACGRHPCGGTNLDRPWRRRPDHAHRRFGPAIRRAGQGRDPEGVSRRPHGLFAGYGFQTVGLQSTTASNAGFITGLSVVLTPLFAGLLLRQPPGRWPVLGACLAAVGLGLLSLQRLEVRQGDALVLGWE